MHNMHDETISTMSEKAADVLLGQPTSQPIGNDFERDLYELRKLADRVLEAMAAAGAQEMAFRGAKQNLPYGRPELEFTLPMPSWEDA